MGQGLLTTDRGFRHLWIGDGLSKVGSQVAILAMPVLAATTLAASTWQVALLATCGFLPLLLIGLPVGAWADRMRRRPVLVGADLGRAVVLLSVPIAAGLGVLTLAQLYVVEFLIGLGTVVFDVFRAAYVPVLVGRSSLVEANGRLELNRTVGYSAGPALGGQLVSWVGPALAAVATAVGFLWSAGWVWSARTAEPVPATTRRHLVREIGDGLRFVLRQPFIRATTLFATAAVAFLATRYAVETLFLLRTVGLSPAGIGFVVTVAGLGTIGGAFAARPIARVLGDVRTVAVSSLAMGAASLLIPLTTVGPGLACYVAGSGLVGFSIVVNNVVAVSLCQMMCPDDMLGRMNATSRFLAWAMLPFGGIIGGALGTALGLRATMWVTAAGLLASAVVLVGSGALRVADPRGSLASAAHGR
jgi:MFS family permease